MKVVARVRLLGIPVPEIALLPFELLTAICAEHDRQQRIAAGSSLDWSPDDIPNPANPNSPPPKGHFVAYGTALGMRPAAVEAEYERQVAAGGLTRA